MLLVRPFLECRNYMRKDLPFLHLPRYDPKEALLEASQMEMPAPANKQSKISLLSFKFYIIVNIVPTQVAAERSNFCRFKSLKFFYCNFVLSLTFSFFVTQSIVLK